MVAACRGNQVAAEMLVAARANIDMKNYVSTLQLTYTLLIIINTITHYYALLYFCSIVGQLSLWHPMVVTEP